jgi:hypothetical protein
MWQAQDVRIAADPAVFHLIVQQEDRAVIFAELLLEAQQLPPIPQRCFGHEPELEGGIEYDPCWLPFPGFLEQQSGHFHELHFGRVKQGGVGVRTHERFDGRQLEQRNGVQRPPMGAGDFEQLLFGF